VAYDLVSGGVWDAHDIVFFLLQVVAGAVVLGLAIGGVSVIWLRWSCKRLEHQSGLVQISITMCCAYWSFIAAESFLGVSGVLCTVISSLVLAEHMWPHLVSKDAMHHAWHMFEFVGNSVIFFLAGALSGNVMSHMDPQDYLHLMVIYIVSMLLRLAMLVVSIPVLRLLHQQREPVPLADIAVMCWGGLRGAVGLALAIQVAIDRAAFKIEASDGRRVLFYTSGVAAITLLVNANTCPALVRWLGVAGASSTKLQVMAAMHRRLEHAAESRSTTYGGMVETSSNAKLAQLQSSVRMQVVDIVRDVERTIHHMATHGRRTSASRGSHIVDGAKQVFENTWSSAVSTGGQLPAQGGAAARR